MQFRICLASILLSAVLMAGCETTESTKPEAVAPKNTLIDADQQSQPQPRLNFRVPNSPLLYAPKHIGTVSIDAKTTDFGHYVANFRERIQSSWYRSIKSLGHKASSGNVVVSFNVLPDGSITDVKALFHDVPIDQVELILESINTAGPLNSWDQQMQQTLGDAWTIRMKFQYT